MEGSTGPAYQSPDPLAFRCTAMALRCRSLSHDDSESISARMSIDEPASGYGRSNIDSPHGRVPNISITAVRCGEGSCNMTQVTAAFHDCWLLAPSAIANQ